MILIIAEKPSLGRNIAEAVGAKDKRRGFIEGNGYLITCAFGHLFSLVDIEEYNPSYHGEKTRWTLENLPCLPDNFRYKLRAGKDGKPDSGIAEQFNTIKALCNRPDVDTIANAGDADREGEIIVRLCLMNALPEGHTKKLVRLWMPDQTPETIRAELAEMKEQAEYDRLADEGFARTYIDWLYGVNLTRYATLKCGPLLRVGRVIIPIVKAIYDRDMAIRNFVPEKYYGIRSDEETNGERVELVSTLRFPKEEEYRVPRACAYYNAGEATVTAVKRKKTVIGAGKLYSLSKLQNVLGKKYKMSMNESLETVQALYERGYLTYPRTNSEYLATKEADKISKIVEKIKGMGYPVVMKKSKNIFDDSKIESHSAITPTMKIPEKGQLSDIQQKVYSTVFRRFAAVFCAEDCVADKTEITVTLMNGERLVEEFTLKGMMIIEKGWTKYDDNNQKDKILPNLKKGDRVNIDFKPVEKETTPPKHYTIETLNNYLKNPFKEERAELRESDDEDDDTAEYRAMLEGLELGTEATRTSIIDNAKSSGYISLKKDTYYIERQGEFLIESLARLGISMDKNKTVMMGKLLKNVYRGINSVDVAVGAAKDEVREIFEKKALPPEEDADIGEYKQLIGKCPVCGRDVIRGTYSYGCTGYREGCKFSVNLQICGRTVSASNMKLLLSEGRTAKINGFISKKTGKTFSARLKLEDGKAVFDFTD